MLSSSHHCYCLLSHAAWTGVFHVSCRLIISHFLTVMSATVQSKYITTRSPLALTVTRLLFGGQISAKEPVAVISLITTHVCGVYKQIISMVARLTSSPSEPVTDLTSRMWRMRYSRTSKSKPSLPPS